MKAILYTKSGEKKSEIELPAIFQTKIREDLAQKYFEISKTIQPYSSSPEAGKHHSASGTISHKRHDWKGHYGRGISRIPRKTMRRRGTQFYWIGAEIPGTRGGRRAHPPKTKIKLRKLNTKESEKAMHSALAATANSFFIKKRYPVKNIPEKTLAVIESLPEKTKALLASIKTIYPGLETTKSRSIRAGKGKSRARKYKTSSGVLIVTGSEEKAKSKTLDIKPINSLRIADLFPLGRLTLFTQKALEELK